MLIRYVQLPMYVFVYIYKNLSSFIFQIFPSTITPSSILFCNFVKFQDQSFHIQKVIQINLYYRLYLLISILIIITFPYLYFFKMFFDILFTEIQVIFINFPIQYFLAKKAVKFISMNIPNSTSIRPQINIMS